MSDEHQGASGAPRSAIGRSQLEWLAAFCEQTARDGIMPTLAWFEETATALRACADALAPAPQNTENDDGVEDRVRELLDDADRAFSAGSVAVTMMVDTEMAQYLRSLLPELPVEVTRRCSFCNGTEFERVQELFGAGWRTRCKGCQRIGTVV